MPIILRFQSREGQFRLNLEPSQDISSILPQVVEKLPKNVIPSSIHISPQPHGGESRAIDQMKGVTFARIGLT
jgi:nuclear protein localization family protein 4